ncbi:hypothetical protein [uncultured Roseovarius sp.]|uniref:hypothetical protein n=1 Tax=uncultured Roseovarius sp. TaxID=293344 RepID=UPI002615ABA7|nr:hypothetical protein [uncultured Roseovarius sp.]
MYEDDFDNSIQSRIILDTSDGRKRAPVFRKGSCLVNVSERDHFRSYLSPKGPFAMAVPNGGLSPFQGNVQRRPYPEPAIANRDIISIVLENSLPVLASTTADKLA